MMTTHIPSTSKPPSAATLKGVHDRGFTLIELLVVILIIGALAAIAIPVFLSQRDKAAAAATKATMRNHINLIVVARENNQSGLKEITSVCSFCACRDRTTPLQVTDPAFPATNCGLMWRRYVDRLAAAAGEPVSVVEKMATDGWGHPLLADENEGELGRPCGDPTINDLLYSFGPDLQFATWADNVVVRVPATGLCLQT